VRENPKKYKRKLRRVEKKERKNFGQEKKAVLKECIISK